MDSRQKLRGAGGVSAYAPTLGNDAWIPDRRPREHLHRAPGTAPLYGAGVRIQCRCDSLPCVAQPTSFAPPDGWQTSVVQSRPVDAR